MFYFLPSCILIVCGNYITTIVNVAPNQQLHCNSCTTLTHTLCHVYTFPPPLNMTLATSC